jgi:hypothetical protein
MSLCSVLPLHFDPIHLAYSISVHFTTYYSGNLGLVEQGHSTLCKRKHSSLWRRKKRCTGITVRQKEDATIYTSVHCMLPVRASYRCSFQHTLPFCYCYSELICMEFVWTIHKHSVLIWHKKTDSPKTTAYEAHACNEWSKLIVLAYFLCFWKIKGGLCDRTGGGLLWMWYWTFGSNKMLREHRVASRAVLSCMQLVRTMWWPWDAWVFPLLSVFYSVCIT